MPIELPRNEFEILKEDEKGFILYDKVVDKLYVYDKERMGWSFPQGSRVDVIFKLTGVEL